MKNTHIIRTFSLLLLTLCILFCSCNLSRFIQDDSSIPSETNDTSTSDSSNQGFPLTLFTDHIDELPVFQSKNRYQFEELSSVADSYNYYGLNKAYFHTENQLCLPVSDGQQGYILAMARDGSIIESRPYTAIYEKNDQWSEGSGATYMMEDGSIYYTTYPTKYIEDTNHCWIRHVGADGQMIASAVIPSTGPNRSMAVLEDREDPMIIVGASDSVCIYDLSLNLITEFPNSTSGSFQRAPDGRFYVGSNWSGQYLCFDPDAMTLESAIDYSVPHNVDSLSDLFFCEWSSAYDRYYADRKGFWGYRQGDAEAELLCSWTESDLTYAPGGNDLTIYGVWDENTLIVRYLNPITNTQQEGFLRRVTGEEQDRIRVTLAFADAYLASMQYNTSNQILEYITDFNRTNETYYIEYVDYADPAYRVKTWSGHPPTHLTPAFEDAALHNTAADLIISWGYAREDMQKYVEANMFVNLSDAVSDLLLPCVVSGYQASDGGLYALPIGIRLHTLVSADDIPTGTLNLQTLYDLASSCTGEQSLFSSRGYNGSALEQNFMAVTMASFADRAAKTCRFDSAEFAEFIRFYENLGQYRAAWNGMTDGMFVDSSERYLEIGSAAYMDNVRNGDILLSELQLDNLNVFGSLYYLFDSNAFTLHGYPTENGERLLIDSEYDIHMNADSKVQRGAAEFLAYLLSDRIQQTDWFCMENFPVTQSGFELMLDARQFFRFNTETPVNTAMLDSVYVNQIVYNFPLSEKPWDGQADITFTEKDKERLRALFYDTPTQSLVDSTLTSILNEELSAYQAGIRSLEETQKILQSRLYIYVNE